MTRIGANQTAASGALRAAGAGGSSGSAAQGAMLNLAGKMAASVNSVLRLTGEDAADQWQGNGSDPYEIEQMVKELADAHDGGASDIGELSRALHAFVQESAALFIARPESRSLAYLQSVIGQSYISGGSAKSLSAISKHVDAATTALRGAVR
jgi:hypothetical protein